MPFIRLDKYYMLVRRFVNASFRLLLRNDWSEEVCAEYNEILTRPGGGPLWCVPITSPRTNAELATTALRTKKYLRALAIMSATSTSRNLRRPSHRAKTRFHPFPSPSSYPPSYTSHLALSIREHTQGWNRLSSNHYYQRCQRTRNRERNVRDWRHHRRRHRTTLISSKMPAWTIRARESSTGPA